MNSKVYVWLWAAVVLLAVAAAGAAFGTLWSLPLALAAGIALLGAGRAQGSDGLLARQRS